MFLMMAAVALTRAVPTTYPGSWFTSADYPPEALRTTKRGNSSFLLLVSPEGKVTRCFITQSSGSPELDKRTCVVMLIRAAFKPAVDETGQPTYDTYRGRVNWRNPDRPNRDLTWRPAPDEPDFELQVKKLPSGLEQQQISLIVRTDPSGHIVYCNEETTSSASPQLASVGCAQAKASYVSVLKDDADKPIGLIRTLNILFKAQAN